MEIALGTAVMLGIIAVLLSWETDLQKKHFLKDKKEQADRMYRLSVIKDLQEKTSYTTDAEKIIDIAVNSLGNFLGYSVISSMVIKDNTLIFKAYLEEQIGKNYIDNIQKSMLSSLSGFLKNIPEKIDKRIYGLTLNDNFGTAYLSSLHVPFIIDNRVIGLIHLSSIKASLYSEKDMEILRQIAETAALSMNRFSQAIDIENHKFTSLISSINDGIFMSDNKNNLFFINDSAKKILKINQENIGFFNIADVLSENINLAREINEVITSNKPYVRKGIVIGNYILDIIITPVDKDKVSVVLRDMTGYKEQEVSKEDVVHTMIHELRSPITTIRDSSELLISTKDFEEDKKLKFLKIIHQQAKKVLGQIGSILDTAKLDAGKLVMQKTKGDIAKLIKDEIQTFTPQAERKNISLSFNVATKSLPEISFDEIRISQVIDNLLSNSLKFTPEGGKIKVEIDYKTIPPVLDGISPMGEFLSLDKYIVVSVSDNGVGLSPEQQKLLFSKHTQAKNTSEEITTMGTGLGLYLVKGIIESHEGRIWVKSVPGQGTTFSFSLPATDAVKPSYDAPRPTATPLSKLSQTVN